MIADLIFFTNTTKRERARVAKKEVAIVAYHLMKCEVMISFIHLLKRTVVCFCT